MTGVYFFAELLDSLQLLRIKIPKVSSFMNNSTVELSTHEMVEYLSLFTGIHHRTINQLSVLFNQSLLTCEFLEEIDHLVVYCFCRIIEHQTAAGRDIAVLDSLH